MTTLHRRDILKLFLLAPALGPGACAAVRSGAVPSSAALAALEKAHGGRLGVCVLDTGTRAMLHWRGDERFALCSTFKLLLAASVLQAIGRGELDAGAGIGFGETDLVPHAPVVEANLRAGITQMTALELAEAAQTTSDNVAANLLIRALGGPDALTAGWRARGDAISRLDRWEPELNEVAPGDHRDTTTPCAMARHVATLVGGDMLAPGLRGLLRRWLVDTRTGLGRLRAGLPPAWEAGDKTGTGVGTGLPNRLNDVAVAWPPGRAPLVIAAYYEAPQPGFGRLREQEAVFPAIARIAAAWAQARPPR